MPSSRNFGSSVGHVQKGSAVSAGNTSKPTRDLEQRTNFLKELYDSIEAGRLLIHREQVLHTDVKAGNAVYYDDVEQQFDRALAEVENDPETSSYVAKKSADCLGICMTKDSAISGTIATVGMVKLPPDIVAEMVEGGIAVPGRYYLSGTTAGKLVKQRPPVTVAVAYILGPADDCETDSWVFIMPQTKDFLEDHIHFQFPLTAMPAGDHTFPGEGNKHVITNADVTLPGWLPADHASFNGMAPTGAEFGYNFAAHPSLDKAWPPLPPEASLLEMLRKSIYTDMKGSQQDFALDFPNVPANGAQDLVVVFTGAQIEDAVLVNAESGPTGDGIMSAWVSAENAVTVRFSNPTGGAINPPLATYHVQLVKHIEAGITDAETVAFQGLMRVPGELVVLDKNGIWWMSCCFNQVPWPTDTDTTPASSSASSVAAGSESSVADDGCATLTPMQLILSFVKMTFATDKTVVTSLQPAEGEPLAYVNCDGLPANTGELFSKLVIALMYHPDEFYGGQVLKEIVDSKLQFGRGWVTEGLIAGNDEIALTSTRSRGLDPTKAVSATNPEVHQGIVTIQAILDPTDRELNPQISLLSDALEREHLGVSFIGLPDGRDSGIRMRYNVPPAGLPALPKMKIRVVIWGLLDGPFSEVTMSYYRIIQPTLNTPTPIVSGDTTLVFDVVTPSDDSDGGGLDLPAENAIEVESAEFTIAPGDTIFVEMLRTAAATPAYAADVGIIRVGGIIVPG